MRPLLVMLGDGEEREERPVQAIRDTLAEQFGVTHNLLKLWNHTSAPSLTA